MGEVLQSGFRRMQPWFCSPAGLWLLVTSACLLTAGLKLSPSSFPSFTLDLQTLNPLTIMLLPPCFTA